MEMLLLQVGQAISVPLTTPSDPAWEGRRFQYHGTSWDSLQRIVRDNFVMKCDLKRYYSEKQWLRNPKKSQGSGQPMVYVAEKTKMAEFYAKTTIMAASAPRMQVFLIVSIPQEFHRWRRDGQRGYLPEDVRPVRAIFKAVRDAPDRDQVLKALSGPACPMMRQGPIIDEPAERLITTCRLRDDCAVTTDEVDIQTEEDEKDEEGNLTYRPRIRCRQAHKKQRRS